MGDVGVSQGLGGGCGSLSGGVDARPLCLSSTPDPWAQCLPMCPAHPSLVLTCLLSSPQMPTMPMVPPCRTWTCCMTPRMSCCAPT